MLRATYTRFVTCTLKIEMLIRTCDLMPCLIALIDDVEIVL